MLLISVTLDTFHADRSWLKALAPSNICFMLVTADTFHADRSWLKDAALLNIDFMLVTADTSHADRSWLKEGAFENIYAMSTTFDTSHESIGPCGPVEQSPTGDCLRHARTAALRSVVFCGANAAVEATCITVGGASLGRGEEKVVLVEARVRPSARRKCDG